jgi:tetratricopeptide (TPR) repeat protein
MTKLCTLIALFVLAGATLYAQESQRYIYEGNSNYKNKNFKDAEIDYRKSLEKDPNSTIAMYNLANSLYKQGNYDEAKEKYEALANENFSKRELARVFHNLGNSYLKNKKYEESIDSYINALKNNPNDKDTKYNLAYARAMLAKQQQQQQNKDKNKNQNNQNKQNDNNQNNNADKNKDQQNQNGQNQNKDSQNKDKQNQNGQNQNKDNQEQNKQNENNSQGENADNKSQNQSAQRPKISKEDAERILQAMMNKEKTLQKKLKVLKSNTKKTEKNW